MRRLHLAILRVAALLVPREHRCEWHAEWRSEIFYVPRTQATRFCCGAFNDALWFRRNHRHSFRLQSPAECLSLLALLAIASLLFTSRQPVDPDARGAGSLVMISPVGHPGATLRLKDYESWNNRWQRVFTGLAFYRPTVEHVPINPRRNAELSIARSSGNLFDVLNVDVPAPHPNSLVLSQAAWREYFDADPRIAGRVVEIAGQRVRIAGVMPEKSWRLPGRIDAWLIEDPRVLAALPPDSRGFVLAHVSKPSIQRMSAPDGSGGEDHFDCLPLAGRIYHPVLAFFMIVTMSVLLLPVTTSLSLGDYPANGNRRQWIFLAAKLVPILAMVWCGARLVAYNGIPVHGLLVGCVLAFRWALVDQRQRCPVCLRLLTNPVRIGLPSQTFLEWYGTEFICSAGHGLLHVPEIACSYYSTQQWLCLDRSWSGLF